MKIDISHVSKLANLQLTDEEKAKFSTQLSSVLEYISKLNEVDTKNVDPTSQVTGLENVTREDVVNPSLTQDEALSQAKNKHNGFFAVKGIFENE
jgi:aspartyl-tRNA(Asn)/glutamyl-tRNA(Gln) amidotransferase subunit C